MVGIPPIKMVITYVFGLLWYCYTNITNINKMNQRVYPSISQYHPILSTIYPILSTIYPLLSTIMDHYEPLFAIKHNWCRISQPSTGFVQHPWRNPSPQTPGARLGSRLPDLPPLTTISAERGHRTWEVDGEHVMSENHGKNGIF